MKVSHLRRCFYNSITPGGLAGGDRRLIVPASGFSLSAQEIWKEIKQNKDLDLPSHKVMVATVRCEQIVAEKCNSFYKNEEWQKLEKEARSLRVPNFGQKLRSILNTCFSEYDSEVTYFDEIVRTTKRKELEEKLLAHVQPSYLLMLHHCRVASLERYGREYDFSLIKRKNLDLATREFTNSIMSHFDEGCRDADITVANWDTLDTSKARVKLNLIKSNEEGKLKKDINTIINKVTEAIKKRGETRLLLLVVKVSISLLLLPMGLGGLDNLIDPFIEPVIDNFISLSFGAITAINDYEACSIINEEI